MKIYFDKDADYDVYKRDYYPLLVREGFSWEMFPELGLYLDKKYPGWQDGTNTDKEHIKPDYDGPGPDVPAIYVKMVTLAEWVDAGAKAENYKRAVMDGKTSSLPHEIGHFIHFDKFGKDGSILWKRACALMGKNMSFTSQEKGGYWWKQSYEDFANYFEDCIEGRKTDPVFMDFVRGLYVIKYRIYLEGKEQHDYTIVNDRAKAPMRSIIDTFKNQRLRYIDWLPATREVIVISAESGY